MHICIRVNVIVNNDFIIMELPLRNTSKDYEINLHEARSFYCSSVGTVSSVSSSKGQSWFQQMLDNQKEHCRSLRGRVVHQSVTR